MKEFKILSTVFYLVMVRQSNLLRKHLHSPVIDLKASLLEIVPLYNLKESTGVHSIFALACFSHSEVFVLFLRFTSCASQVSQCTAGRVDDWQ